MTHLTFEEISELAERGGLDHPAGQTAESEHVAHCAECGATFKSVRALLDATRALPREVAPPADAWPAVRERVRREALPRRPSWTRGMLAAASIVFVVGAMAIVGLTLRGRAAKLKGATLAHQQMDTAPVVRAVDRNYDATILELRAALASQRSQLSSSTLRTVDRALTVIDSAIAEARTALAADPANQAIMDILAGHYERKVDLLQRAAELSSS